MKKYNKTSSFNVFWGIIIPTLLFFASVNVTFAFFSAQSSAFYSAPVTAVLNVCFDESTQKVNSSVVTGTTKVIPGDELIINTKIANSGTAPLYAIISFKIEITKSDGKSRLHVNKNYTISNSTLTEIYASNNNYTNHAFELAPNEKTGSYEIKYKFNGDVYDNSYKNAEVFYQITVNGIQMATFTAETATKTLMQSIENNSQKIVGNTIVSGTPSIDAPATIQSVGDRTKNLINIDDQNVTLTASRSKNTYTNFLLSTGKTYTLSFDYNINYINEYGAYYFLAIGCGELNTYTKDIVNITYNTSVLNGKMTATFTVPEDANGKYLSFRLLRMLNQGNASYTISNIQLEEGSTATEYEPYGKYKIPMEVKSKNLVNIASDFEWTGTHIESITLPAGTYTVSWSGSVMGSSVDPYLRLSDGITCSLKSAGGTYTFTLDSELNTSLYLYANGYNFNGSNGITSSVQNFMIEAGSTATEYEPYYQSTQNIYLDEPLRKIGNVADYIDLETGEVVRMVGKFVLDGSESWDLPSGTVSGFTPFRITNMSNWKANGSEFICNMLEYSGNGYNKNYNCCAGYDSPIPQLFLVISNDLIPLNDITALKQWLKDLYDNNTPMCVIHMLATPTTEYVDVSNIPVGAKISVLTTLAPSN